MRRTPPPSIVSPASCIRTPLSYALRPMNRRLAIQSALAAAMIGASGLSGSAAAAKRILKPSRLVKGDTIGLIAPASNAIENEEISFAADIVRSLGFEVKEGKYLYSRNEYLAGTDLQRADDVNRMFGDSTVDAIFCLHGGYGTPRILPHLDFDLIGKNPKALIGYSDITALLIAIYVQTGPGWLPRPNRQSDYFRLHARRIQKDSG